MRDLGIPDEIDPNAAYEDTLTWYVTHAKEYAEKIEHLEPPEIRTFMSRLSSPGEILDIGCAAGRDTAYFGEKHKATGIDAVRDFISIATAQCPGCNFLVADATALPFEDNKFDAICMRSILLHLPDELVRKALQEAKRVAKPGALGFIRVKKRQDGEKYIVGSIERRTDSNRLFNLFSQDEIEALIRDAGIHIESLEESSDDDNPSVVCINITVIFS